MKRFLVCLGLFAALVTGVTAQAADTALLQRVLVLDLAESLGLEDGQTIAMMGEFKDYAAQAAVLEASRSGLEAKIQGADASADVIADLTQLKETDQKLAALRASAAVSLASGLSSVQAAKVYLFMANLPTLTATALSGAPCTAAPAAATCAAAAGAAPAGAAQAIPAASDEDLVKATVNKVKTALEKLDLDMLLETFSEEFNHPEVGGKEEARYMLEMGIDMGYAEDGEVNLDDMEIEIDGDEATVYPLELSSPAGSVSVELVLAKEGDKWLITTLNPDGM